MSITNMNENGTGNDEELGKNQLSVSRVDAEAKRLADSFGNHSFIPFYCKVIYRLGLQRVKEIEGRVSDAKYPGRLFTTIAKEEMANKNGRRNDIDQLWGRHDL